MESGSFAAKLGGVRWRLWALVPSRARRRGLALRREGGSLLDLVGQNPPPRDEFDIRRVEFQPGEIRIRVTNPQRDDLTIAAVTVDDAIVPYTVDGSATLGRLRSARSSSRTTGSKDDPISVGVTSSTGIQTTQGDRGRGRDAGAPRRELPRLRAHRAPGRHPPGRARAAWLPSLRRASREWLAAFMALTAGLLTFLALEALSEALDLQAALPSGLGGVGSSCSASPRATSC